MSYRHPDWETAIWDSEDKVAIPWDTLEGETEVSLEINASLTISVDTKGNPEKIEELTFNYEGMALVIRLYSVDEY